MTLLRTTLHLVTARDALALRPIVQGMIERRFHTGTPFGRNLAGVDLDALLAAGIELVEEQPRGVSDLSRLLTERFPGYDAGSLGAAIAFLVPLVQVTPRGVWGATRRPLLTTLSSWLGAPVTTGASPDAAILRYLRAYGPTTADIRVWSSLSGVREVIDRLRPRLRTYRDETGRELFDVTDGLFAPPDAEAPPRLLPEYDNVMLSHDDRSRITGERPSGMDFGWKGTALVDGFLSGAWRLRTERRSAVLELELLARVSPAGRAGIAAEAERLLTFLAAGASERALHIVER